MATSAMIRPRQVEGFPDVRNYEAVRTWLESQPAEWLLPLAMRAALRVLPLTRMSNISTLAIFRAHAITYFAARFPKGAYRSEDLLDAANGAFTAAYSAASNAAGRSNAAFAAADAVFAAGAEESVVTAVADAVTNAADAARSARLWSAFVASVRLDVSQLSKELTPTQLAMAPLWLNSPPPRVEYAWQEMAHALSARDQWSVWIDWYNGVRAGAAVVPTDMFILSAFTDLSGPLPWDRGVNAVSVEIIRRLREGIVDPFVSPPLEVSKSDLVARLAEVASPQPVLNSEGQLDAGPNRPFDVPKVDDDLSLLPIRQHNLINIILSDLPRNAPTYLKASLRSYAQELRVRGVQPILPLLKDDADIIAAAVHAPRAEDEWLEPGLRKAFEKFDKNHGLFVEYFPLDIEREAVYAQTPLDEEQAFGKNLVAPFEEVSKATQDAQRSGLVTSDFAIVIEKFTELVRVVSTQPVMPVGGLKPAPDIRVSPEDRIQPITTKKRILFGSLGFFAGTIGIIASLGRLATLEYSVLAARLKEAVEALWRLIH